MLNYTSKYFKEKLYKKKKENNYKNVNNNIIIPKLMQYPNLLPNIYSNSININNKNIDILKNMINNK